MRKTAAKVKSIVHGSPAEIAGLMIGDIVEGVDGYGMVDIIDWRYLTSDYSFTLQVLRGESQLELSLQRDYMQDLGVEFEEILFDGIRECANKCIFCFVDQLPSGVRDSLCIKDDDYRLSFLQGNFVTLTNCSNRTLDRIIGMRMSPLYVSVHATDPEVRNGLLGRKAGKPILEVLSLLGSNGIDLHTQIVVVPGFNDSGILDRSIKDLSDLHPAVKSIGIVPVGLTKHRRNDDIRSVSASEAQITVDLIEGFQKEFLGRFGTRLVWAADEYYLKADRQFPEGVEYEGYIQIENGIGLARSLYDDVEDLLASNEWVFEKDTSKDVIVTGIDGAKVLRPIIEGLRARFGAAPAILGIENRYFGQTVTVTGLTVGADIVSAIKRPDWKIEGIGRVLIPDIMLRKGDSVFLDGTDPASVEKALGVPLEVVPTDAAGLLSAAGLRARGDSQ